MSETTTPTTSEHAEDQQTPAAANIKRRRIPTKPVALLLGAATFVGGAMIANNRYQDRNNKVENYVTQEARVIEAARTSGKIAVLDALVVVRDANIRETPDAINARFTIPGINYDVLKGNVSSRVSTDERLVGRQPYVLTKEDGSAWIGFQMQGPEVAEGEYVSSVTVAERMKWINYSQIKEATDDDGNKLVEVFPLGTNDEVSSKMLAMTEQGQIVDNGIVGARAQLFQGDVVRDLMQLQGITVKSN